MGAAEQPDRAGTAATPAANGARAAHQAENPDVGAALRSVYQKTIEEKVPDEFLDLLGKLG